VHAHGFQLAQQLGPLLHVLHHHCLGDLELEEARIEAAVVQRGFDLAE
jgi:hypothetical protein